MMNKDFLLESSYNKDRNGNDNFTLNTNKCCCKHFVVVKVRGGLAQLTKVKKLPKNKLGLQFSQHEKSNIPGLVRYVRF